MSSIAQNDFIAPEGHDACWEAWREHVHPFFDLAQKPEIDLTTAPAMRTFFLGNMMIGDVDAPAQILERTARKTAVQGIDHILLQFHTHGTSRVERGGHSRTVGPSEVVVYDLSQPIMVDTAGPVGAVNAVFPRALLGERAGSLDLLHGATFSRHDDPVAQLMFDYLKGVIARGGSLPPQQARPVAEAAAKLCTACLPARGAGERTGDLATSIEIRSFIQKNIGDADLDVDGLVSRFGVSRASLYRLFSDEGGVQSYIRERRLLKAMRLLAQPSGGARPRVSSVAYACGFTDAKTFTRAFTARFGFLPREARAGDADPALLQRRDDVLLDWINTLDA
jgi:AraC-like DNA-binding protein